MIPIKTPAKGFDADAMEFMEIMDSGADRQVALLWGTSKWRPQAVQKGATGTEGGI